MSEPLNPFDPIGEAFKALHNGNLVAAQAARIKQLEDELKQTQEVLKETQENSASFERQYWSLEDKLNKIEANLDKDEVCKFFLVQKREENKRLAERLEAMREAGDAIWYCVRHAQRVAPEELIEAIEDWREARNDG